ncbi:MAG: putative DNA ligase [Candidatus Woesebacteria bacterium GW2011_GWA1_33_30]|uniref:DNA ligase (ATP) n=1 Tax=Candidatus Woesebacteria bacterium GW2011_GWA2_33_28 TaxID=1618561 RepID=A0A0F9ZT97_9BACT|nr:MAG: putative DNA ligase [Candidatus Woesebacteria bacterium GW2011_GWA2_33_28]KKP48410.1 MAG: putative DNA ligase [Candidatus Woesebacteria bacterium GW2011_GWA1_33_30]KKP49517.1 MAG: putative DNA ligase [Microgenomates group bacterium GW2011_GWC1_33_32]KKP52482.1 MAG: putative DNA ligase [Candidatus Woesebacteria bacterium GW2011_GWB1_33_38]KKP58340.1 MAG: putative DNA ligase [Microgenomates group bacterium GW2011_GWD1_33_9]
MYFSDFAKYLERLEKTASRLEITAILKELFEKTDKSEIKEVVYLSLGVLAPNYEGVLLNLAEKMVARSISLAYGEDLKKVTKLYKEMGDLGNVAESLSVTSDALRVKKIPVSQVFDNLLTIAKDGGEGSQDRKIVKFAELLKNLDSLSVRYVTRIPVGKLRLGFSEKTILDALGMGEEEYNIHPDIGNIAKLAISHKLSTVSPKIGVPVVPMLAQRLNSTTEMIAKMGEVAVEPKFDGLRIFIHFTRKPKSLVWGYTRNMNSLPMESFPELKDIGKYIKADEIILDTEAVGLDPKREMFVDFQKTIQRRRKHDIKKSSGETPLQFQVFDILLVDGKSLIHTLYQIRRQKLEQVIIDGGPLRIDESTITKDPEVIKRLHEKYLKMGLEGVVVKRANGHYVSGRTGWNWVKMKEDEGSQGRLSDTLDCIVMGYWKGLGKRAQFGLGKILVGIKNGDKIMTLTKVGTGLTEAMLVEIKNRLNKLKSKVKPKEYEAQKDLIPDVWVIPSLVVEVTADSISKSTKHSLGLSLRFPRFIKIREDKGPNEATTLKELKEITN